MMASNSDDPLLVYLSFNALHDPRQFLKFFYITNCIPLPENWLLEYLNMKEIGLESIGLSLAHYQATSYAIKLI